jgi:cytidine deaminase
MCAERVAIFSAIAQGARTFDAIAVAGPDGVRTMPCGACRQVLFEFAPQLRVIYAEEGAVKMMSIAQLLPEAFSAQVLNDHAPVERGLR